MNGGAATNSGIDFQHRAGALALVTMLTDLADLGTVGLGEAGETPTQVRFESADGIDDIVLELPEARILIQAKNTISLSTGEEIRIRKGNSSIRVPARQWQLW